MAQEKVFIDATYWIALLHPKDNNHEIAKQIEKTLSGYSLWTSELVLIEILDFFCGKGQYLRKVAALAVDALRAQQSLTIIPLDGTKFEPSFLEFKRYGDKGWSVTDCSSFVVMREKAIPNACAYDGHFEQAQFVVLK